MEQFERIRREHREEGVSIRELARRHNVHRRAVRQALESAVPPPRRPVEGRAQPAAERMTSAGLAAVPDGPRPGIAPLVGAALRSLVADGSRVFAFLVGALLLSWVTVAVGLLGLGMMAGGPESLGAGLMRSPEYAARMLVLTPIVAFQRVIAVGIVVGYIGMRMPPRMVAASTMPERTIRRGVAIVGALLLGGLTWFVLPLQLTPVLAVGVTVLPIVFAIAALRGPRRPPVAKGVRPYLLLAGVLVLGSLGDLAFTLSGPSTGSDLSAFGEPASAAGLHPDPEWPIRQVMRGRDGTVEGWTSMPDLPADELDRLASVETQVRAAEVREGRLTIGEVLGGASRVPVQGEWTALDWSMPAPKVPRLVAIFTVATMTDGRDVILDPEPRVEVAPAWRGRLFDYWFGG